MSEYSVIKEGRPVHKCSIPAPNSMDLGAVVRCECGRRWKLRRQGVTFKGWSRTIPTFTRDLVMRKLAVNKWASVRRWQVNR